MNRYRSGGGGTGSSGNGGGGKTQSYHIDKNGIYLTETEYQLKRIADALDNFKFLRKPKKI